jgi:hypothetical protein
MSVLSPWACNGSSPTFPEHFTNLLKEGCHHFAVLLPFGQQGDKGASGEVSSGQTVWC